MAAPPKHWLAAFLRFCELVTINSKEEGLVPLKPYDGQLRFLTCLSEGLENDIHDFKALKGRQLGITTVMMLLDIFWLYMFPGLQGALIFDTAKNLGNGRRLITDMLNSLPEEFRVPVKSHNREELVLGNGSSLQYMSAGRNSKLGISRAINFLHATECGNWSDQEGIENLKATLAQTNPNRLYIWESTAFGFNTFHKLYQDAKESPAEQTIFLGWWSKSLYSFPEDSEQFARWWGEDPELSEYEAYCQHVVKEDYGHDITPAQWAWYRSEAYAKGDQSLKQMYPTYEEEAWQETGHSFFPLKRLTADQSFIYSQGTKVGFEGFKYHLGMRFTDTKLERVGSPSEAELRVWEQPKTGAKYVIGVDPAFGRDEEADCSVIEVYRCFADKLVQVAEYATPMPETRQVAWVLAHVAGCYRDSIVNLEVSGPGAQVMAELRYLKEQMDYGKLRDTKSDIHPDWALDNMRWFLWTKPDSLAPSYVYNWKCLALDTPLPTPSGWTTMGEVKKGDWLLDDRGKPTQIKVAHPVRHNLTCYRVGFDDGSSIVADAEHLWRVTSANNYHVHLRKTEDLRPGVHRIARAESLALSEAELPIDPYVLGVWLGDGSSAKPYIFMGQEDQVALTAEIAAAGYEVGNLRVGGRSVYYRVVPQLGSQLKAAGLINNKHIPAAYLRASEAQRMALLQGLMDTDGSCSAGKQRQCSFVSTNLRLAEGFAELLRSLGFKSKSCMKIPTVKYKGEVRKGAPARQFWFTAYPERPVFRIARKKDRLTRDIPSRKHAHHRIVSVELMDTVPVRCVKVDNERGMFLAGTSMIPTHNTNLDNKFNMLNRMRDSYATEELLVRSIPLLQEMVTFTQDGLSLRAGGTNKDDRVFATGLAHYAWAEWVRTPMMQAGQSYESVMNLQAQAESRGNSVNVTDWIVKAMFAEAEQRKAEEIDRARRILEF